MTRTDEGYANWKERPDMVAAARVQAKGAIARKYLWLVGVESWAVPVVVWLNRLLDPKSSGKGEK